SVVGCRPHQSEAAPKGWYAMLRLAVAPIALVLVAAALPTGAQESRPDGENGRYAFNTVSDGVLRLDTRTGQVSKCSNASTGWACQAVPDDRKALENEIGRLQDENARLKKEFASRGLKLPDGVRDAPVAGRDRDGELKLPSDAELDRVMTFL